jgi:adenylyltransferase/sulfurtransferase
MSSLPSSRLPAEAPAQADLCVFITSPNCSRCSKTDLRPLCLFIALSGCLTYCFGAVDLDGTEMIMELNNDELRRYSRHLILPEVGLEGQKKIRSASVLCIGAGGLGSPIALYLAAAGIGKLGLVDFDVVDLSNLQRQIIHGTGDIGRLKTESARDTLSRLNPHVDVVLHSTRLSSQNALDIIRPYDIVADGSDNFPTRYLINDACVLLGKPNVYGSIFRFEGQASVFAPHLGGPCYRCLFPEPPPPGLAPSCAEAGVLGVLPGIIGLIQATETLKLALGQGLSLMNRLLLFNALDLKFREIKLRRDPQCAACGEHPTLTRLVDFQALCALAPSPGQPPAPSTPSSLSEANPGEVTVEDLKRALDGLEPGLQLIDVREPDESRIARIPGARLLPLSQLAHRYTELDPGGHYYLHCHHGVRSLRALEFLRQHGFKHLKTVKGGIDAWSSRIDPLVPRY